jgi:transcription-repair coupling factor (superfamily II helicase)
MDVHRRIALAQDEGQLRDLELELADRFGPLPEPVANLIAIQELRLAALPLGGVAIQVGRDGARITGLRVSRDEVRALGERHADLRANAAKDEIGLPVRESGSPLETARELADAMIGLRSAAPSGA